MQTPVHTIASNAGVEGAVVVGKLLEQDNPDLGYDAAKGQSSLYIYKFLNIILAKNCVKDKYVPKMSPIKSCRYFCSFL
jgi:chaperonin GroEL (HSP60 family)